ncbi:ubiquitin-like domain-containing CTD phosphatase 1 [Ruditapes philippinarum]|uniref:ubiquitin-like domain-containing CTD phosphatase 1 n=1 Tax=Ruditapes philippinarum TaxID=129788 RepID=UPI00295C0861|nr:ubiquitin-like domain-containing CTD phosphatase 1 [Ruditapes philippinarum]
MADVLEFCVKWSGKEYMITALTAQQTVSDMKIIIHKETGVLPERQKLLGLKFKGKVADDSVVLGDLKLKPGTKIMMMGTREEEITKIVEPPPDLPEVVNDFDIEEDEIAIENREEFLQKIEKRVKDYKIDIITEPRDGKKLLVLDIDYTLFDHRSVAETANELIRPFLHEFLTSAYDDYDIVIWSATGMKWIEVKMKELGVTSHTEYKICFMIDSGAMISVHSPKYGVIDVKPLGVIWGKYPQWGPHNTIMFDDIRRNFIMNPQTGLKIRPFRQAHFNREKDRELLKLAKYLKDIAALDNFTVLNHRKWEKYRPKRKHADSNISEGEVSSKGVDKGSGDPPKS